MIRSMTAFARERSKTEEGLFVIEIHSVNRKGLDLNINLPKELLSFDISIRKKMNQVIHRGYVTLRILREDTPENSIQGVEVERLKKIQKEWLKCAEELGYAPYEAVSFGFLLSQAVHSSFAPAAGDRLKGEIERGVSNALQSLCEMKEMEGGILAKDILERIGQIEKYAEKIDHLSEGIPKGYIDKLRDRLDEHRMLGPESEERLVRELVIFSEKVDISEEITRLKSHITQFKQHLTGKKKCSGKELDFLVQEMNREVNTIASKSPEIEVIQLALKIKGEQEKIREQLQNIE